MSQLNLSPDPVVLGVQAVLFLTNLVVVKKLILEPYLEVRARREASTGGSQDKAQKLLEQVGVMEQTITEKMRQAHKEAATSRERIREEAQGKRSKILGEAEAEAKKSQENILKSVEQNLVEERTRKDETIIALAKEFYAQVVR